MPVVKKVVKKSSKPSTASKSTAKKTVKKTVKKVTKKVATPAPEPTPEPVETPVPSTTVSAEETPATTSTESTSTPTLTLTENFDALLVGLQACVNTLRDVAKSVRQLRTVTDRRVRAAERAARVANRQRARRTPNNTPRLLDEELSQFLGVEHGTKMSMTDVCSQLTSYFKEHSLHSEDNRTHLVLDSALSALFAPDEGVTVTTRNYRRFVTPHFVSA